MHNEQLRRRCGATFFARVASVVTTSLLAYLSVAGAPPGVSAQTDVTPTPTATPALALATDTPTPTETAVVVETPVPTITPTPFVSGVPCDGGRSERARRQYVQAVDNPDDVSEDIADTVNRLDRELRSIQRDRRISLAEAEERLNGVLERFNELGGSLGDQRDERDD